MGDMRFGMADQGNNLYIKNLPYSVTADRLETEFSPYGQILSAKVITDENGQSRGFGFVRFSTVEEANAAVNEMNGKMLDSMQLFVAIAQKRENRNAPQFQEENLYIKNLDARIDDQRLRTEFEKFGNVISAKVMTDESGFSRGFGFVRFQSASEANQAVNEMNGKQLEAEQLHVSLARAKKDANAGGGGANNFGGVRGGPGQMFQQPGQFPPAQMGMTWATPTYPMPGQDMQAGFMQPNQFGYQAAPRPMNQGFNMGMRGGAGSRGGMGVRGGVGGGGRGGYQQRYGGQNYEDENM